MPPGGGCFVHLSVQQSSKMRHNCNICTTTSGLWERRERRRGKGLGRYRSKDCLALPLLPPAAASNTDEVLLGYTLPYSAIRLSGECMGRRVLYYKRFRSTAILLNLRNTAILIVLQKHSNTRRYSPGEF